MIIWNGNKILYSLEKQYTELSDTVNALIAENKTAVARIATLEEEVKVLKETPVKTDAEAYTPEQLMDEWLNGRRKADG